MNSTVLKPWLGGEPTFVSKTVTFTIFMNTINFVLCSKYFITISSSSSTISFNILINLFIFIVSNAELRCIPVTNIVFYNFCFGYYPSVSLYNVTSATTIMICTLYWRAIFQPLILMSTMFDIFLLKEVILKVLDLWQIHLVCWVFEWHLLVQT